jgi:hypothetical protein
MNRDVCSSAKSAYNGNANVPRIETASTLDPKRTSNLRAPNFGEHRRHRMSPVRPRQCRASLQPFNEVGIGDIRAAETYDIRTVVRSGVNCELALRGLLIMRSGIFRYVEPRNSDRALPG